MSDETVNQMQKQFDSMLVAPMRTYASLMLDHFEQVANLQVEAMKAYAETGARQARAALDIKEPADVNAYMETQQSIAKEFGERLKRDADKVASLNQEFADKTRKVTEDNARTMSEAAQAGMSKTSGATRKSARSTAKAAPQSE